MSRQPVAIVYSRHADPRLPGNGSPPPHVVREEIPHLERVLRERGVDVLVVPVGNPVLDSARELALRSPRVVINLCEDLLGDSAHEMHFASMLELLGLSLTGSPPLVLGLCRDKGKSKSLLRQYGIPTPDFVVTREREFSLGAMRYPLIAKPSLEDGSLGIDDSSVAVEEQALRRRVASLLECYEEVIVEEYVDGRELNVAVFGNDPPRVLPVSEIDFSGLPPGSPSIVSYAAKWEDGDRRYRGTVPVCPAPLEESERAALTSLSLAVFRLLGMRDYARIDWRLSAARGPQFLEANPNPDISPASGFMRSLRAAGMDYPELADLLLRSAAERARRKNFTCPGESGGARS